MTLSWSFYVVRPLKISCCLNFNVLKWHKNDIITTQLTTYKGIFQTISFFFSHIQWITLAVPVNLATAKPSFFISQLHGLLWLLGQRKKRKLGSKFPVKLQRLDVSAVSLPGAGGIKAGQEQRRHFWRHGGLPRPAPLLLSQENSPFVVLMKRWDGCVVVGGMVLEVGDWI